MERLHERVLVIVLAETRAHELTYASFEQNLLEVTEADLCLCIAKNDREDPENPFYRHAKFVWTYDEPEDWGDAFDHACRVGGYDEGWRRLLDVEDQWLGGIEAPNAHPGSAAILLFFRWFLRQRLIETGIAETYDRFILTRSDFIHRTPHVPLHLLDPAAIWIPDGEDYFGYTDRHIVANREDFLQILAITDWFLAFSSPLREAMLPKTNWNLEQVIRFHFRSRDLERRVRRYPYTMYSVRAADGHTRYQRGVYYPELGYCIKYPGEYKSALLSGLVVEDVEEWDTRTLFVVDELVRTERRLDRVREHSQTPRPIRFGAHVVQRLLWWKFPREHAVTAALVSACASFLKLYDRVRWRTTEG